MVEIQTILFFHKVLFTSIMTLSVEAIFGLLALIIMLFPAFVFLAKFIDRQYKYHRKQSIVSCLSCSLYVSDINRFSYGPAFQESTI